jgi:hypothetical protein
MSASNNQVGGNHYKKYKIQPVEYTIANNLSFLAGNVIKYVTRYKDKGGAEDIRKAMHYLELILQFEYPPQPKPQPMQQTGQYGNASGPPLILKLESEDPDTVGEPR